MRMSAPLFLGLLLSAVPCLAYAPRTIHLFVPLCDNQHQGIVPVPASMGRGDDPQGNLYWGLSGGVRSTFSHSPAWERLLLLPNPRSPILERAVFRHKASRSILIADAYDGSHMENALEDFLRAVSGNPVEGQAVPGLGLSGGSRSDLVAFLGHNGLMDTHPLFPQRKGTRSMDCMVLCCKSEKYFSGLLGSYGARPQLLTAQLMYPGAMVFEDALEGWLLGEGPVGIKERAAQAYARNQGIGIRPARSIFWQVEEVFPPATQ